MTTICPGWTTPHQPPVVLKPEDGINAGAVSHGMCAACKADMERELKEEEQSLSDTYLIVNGKRIWISR